MVDQASTQTGPDVRRTGAVIMSVFGLIWAMAGASGTGDGAGFWAIVVAAVIVSAVLVVIAVRSESTRTGTRQLAPDWQRQYNLVGIVQAVAIAVAIFALVTLDLPGLIPPVVCLIVGIHFFPLQSTFDQPEYRGTGLALCGVAAIGGAVIVLASDEAARAVVGLGAALVLWATSAAVALRG